MPAQSDAERALTLVAQSGFEMNDACDQAHAIAQAHEGEPLFDAIHALIHRIEGDHANAAYWDRRAGTDFGGLGFDKELAAIRQSMRS